MTSQRQSVLISSDSEMFQFWFSAVHYLKISEKRWRSLIFDGLGENDNFQSIFHCFLKFSDIPFLRTIILNFCQLCYKKSAIWISLINLCTVRKDYDLKFWVFVTAQVTKPMWFNFCKMFSRLVGSNFKNISKKCVFVVILLNIYLFFNTRNAILMTTSCIFVTSDYVITIWYSHLHVSISELIQSKSALDRHSSELKTQCFRAKK